MNSSAHIKGEAMDKNLIEGQIGGLQQSTKGGWSDCWYSEYDCAWIGDKPVRRTHNRLIIIKACSADSISFQTLRFARDLTKEFKEPYACSHTLPVNRNLTVAELNEMASGWEYVGGADMQRYDGISFTAETMHKIMRSIQTMIGKSADHKEG